MRPDSPDPPAAPLAAIPWYALVWLAIPFALVAAGGAIGGGIGGAAWGLNQTLYRKVGNPVARYGLTGLVSVGAFGLYLVAAAQIREWLGF